METIFLTKAQQNDIAYEICDGLEFDDGEAIFDFEYEQDGVMLYIYGKASKDGYVDDDYFRGTGTFITTYAGCLIYEITACKDDEEVELVYDRMYIEHIVEQELKH